jgi:hypothetical protein
MKRSVTTDHGQITTDITEKGGHMGTKESVGKVLKKAVRILPGVGSYQDKESLRESDKKLRDHISTQLAYCMETFERLKTGISRSDDISRQIDTLSRTITFAARGYSGVFNSNLVDEKVLLHLFEFDQSFQKEVDLLSSLVVTISKKNKELDSTMLDEVWAHLLKIKKRINEREKLLKGPSD